MPNITLFMRGSCSTLGGQSTSVHSAITSLPTVYQGQGRTGKKARLNESKAVMPAERTTPQTAGMSVHFKPQSKKDAMKVAQRLDKQRAERKMKFKRTHNLVTPMPVRHNILSPFKFMAKLPLISVSNPAKNTSGFRSNLVFLQFLFQ